MPVVQYFLIVGSVLTGLIFYANDVLVSAPLAISVSQKTGLPEPYRARVTVAEVPAPVIVATTAEPPVEVKKPAKAVRQHRAAQVVRQTILQGRYAAYPPRESGSIW